MKSYKKYIEPVIGNILPLLERPEFKKDTLKNLLFNRHNEFTFTTADLVKMLNVSIARIKSPLFELKLENTRNTAISNFYYLLHVLYTTNISRLYSFFFSPDNEDLVHFLPHESGDKRKIKITRDVSITGLENDRCPAEELGYNVIPRGRGLKMQGVPKKYRGILARQHYTYKIGMNKSIGAQDLWLVPKKGKTEDVYNLLKGISDTAEIEVRLHKFKDLSKIVQYRDASVANNKRRTGALTLERELAEEIQSKGKMVRASHELRDISNWYAHVEHNQEEEIAKQQALVDELKTKAQEAMSKVVDAGMDAKTDSFKNTQTKVEKFLKAEQELNALTEELLKIKDKRKFEIFKQTQSIKREVAEHFHGLKK